MADYCEEALALGMETLGFSDHSALPDDRWLSARMEYGGLDDYVQAMDRARIDYPTLNVVKGMECEYLPEFHSFYQDELLDEKGFDYLVGAAHSFPLHGEWVGTYGGTRDRASLRAYADYVIDMMATGLFDFIAHPDLFGNCYAVWDRDTDACSRDILNAAREYDVGMEINALGMRKQARKSPDNPFPLYPWRPFWELAAECDAPVIVNSDAHRPEDLQGLAGQGAYASGSNWDCAKWTFTDFERAETVTGPSEHDSPFEPGLITSATCCRAGIFGSALESEVKNREDLRNGYFIG